MKRFLSIILSFVAGASMLAFSACAVNGGGDPSADNEQTGSNEDNGGQNTPSDPQTPQIPAGDSDILIVYFSATGNTEEVAGYIADATGGTIFELVPVQPYTSADLRWTDENSRVVQEYENPELRDVELTSTTVENWAEYDTVFIGYPIWWGIAAWPVNGFVQDNDFTGKTVIPFCTSSSSGLGQSGQLLAAMAGEGNWQEGHRFRSGASQSDVISWLRDLGVIE